MSAVATAPELEFAVTGARPVRHAAAPMLGIDLEVRETTGRPVYMIALTVRIMLEPARRTYDEATRARLVELFGPPERWAVTTRSLLWTQLDVVVPAFTDATAVSVPLACHYDLELAAARYLHALPDDAAPLVLHFNGTVYYADAQGSLQIVLVPWSHSIDWRMPVAVWREAVAHHYPGTAWVAVREDTFEALEAVKRAGHHPTLDACLHDLLSATGAER